MKLYELDNQYLEAINNAVCVDEETGEVFINQDLIDALQGTYETKIDNIVCVIKEMQALSDAIKKEEEALNKRRKTLDKKIDWWKGYIAHSLELRGLEKLETPRNRLSFRTSKSVQVTNESLIDDRYFITVLDKKLDKKMLLADLKSGAEIEGCVLMVKSNLQVK